MMTRAAQIGTLALAICLGAAANDGTPVGFVDLPRLLAVHPLHKVLDAYDREIAALRGTRAVPGLADPAARAGAAAAALRRDAAQAQDQVQRIAFTGDARYRALEAHALSAVAASRYGRISAMDAYVDALARETGANVRGYEAAIAQQTARALAARQQQLREKELALAYALAQRDAGARLMLRAKLADARLPYAKRAPLEAELAALRRRESAAVAALHAQNVAELARYRRQSAREAAAAGAQMVSQLRSKADANLTLRRNALRAAGSAQVAPDLPTRLATLGSSYRLGSDAVAIRSGLQSAATELPQRFAQLAETDRASQAEAAAQLANLQRDRAELYRAMVAQIVRDAQRLGRERGLRNVVVSASRPRNGVDLTVALAREESRF
ncbi:MAG TPA: hypothetical protein VMT95_10075 [Candidatus Binatia bacterium]|nr:hypothetical protein [Candidatus Binatia bacterium]